MIKKAENVHILLWLLKDIAWCMVWKPLGIFMIFPTLAMAVFIAYANRLDMSDLVHNISVVFWITANSIWMLTEFFGVDENLAVIGVPGKWIAGVFFVLGITLILGFYMRNLYKVCANYLMK